MPELQTLLTGLAFGESPRWHEGRLWFSNWGRQEVIAVDLEGHSEVMARVPTTLPFCIDWLPDGRLLVVSGPEGLLLRQEADGQLLTHATLSTFASIWNEIVVDGRGNIYVNGGAFDAPGVIVLVTPDGAVRQVASDLAFPNGMCITPDNRTLIIAESFANRLTAFEIDEHGSLSKRRVWAAFESFAPDGVCLDAEGAVWFGDVPNRRCIRVKEGGEIVQTIHLDRGCFACMLGGPSRQRLFLLAAEWHGFEHLQDQKLTGQLLVSEVPVPSAGWP